MITKTNGYSHNSNLQKLRTTAVQDKYKRGHGAQVF